MNTVVSNSNDTNAFESNSQDAMAIIPHTVREFGVEARKEGRAWEAAFNGPIQSWTDQETEQITYGVTVRLSRLKDPITRELFSTNLLFYFAEAEMHGIHNVYEMARRFPFTRIRGPRTPVPVCPARVGRLWYDANPEGVIMEDVRLTPVTLPEGGSGFFVTGQGYRGKVMLADGRFIHDVGVYGGYLNPSERPGQLELQHLFGGIEFESLASLADDRLRTELGEGVWVKGIAESEAGSPHVESYKNSVKLPSLDGQRTLIGARSMSQTKQIAYFESQSKDGLSGFRLGGVIDGLHRALGLQIWDRGPPGRAGQQLCGMPGAGRLHRLDPCGIREEQPGFPGDAGPRASGHRGAVRRLGRLADPGRERGAEHQSLCPRHHTRRCPGSVPRSR